MGKSTINGDFQWVLWCLDLNGNGPQEPTSVEAPQRSPPIRPGPGGPGVPGRSQPDMVLWYPKEGLCHGKSHENWIRAGDSHI